MSTEPLTPAARWDGWTESQRIEWIATDILQWHKELQDEPDGSVSEYWTDGFVAKVSHKFGGHLTDYWNPLADENDFRMVLEKVMQNQELLAAFMLQFDLTQTRVNITVEDISAAWMLYLMSSLPVRCRALYLAHSSLHP